jgi:hypothetical protein
MPTTTNLIDMDFTRQHLPSSVDADEPTLWTLIGVASRAVQKYCRRDFVQTPYDELYNGLGDRRLVLRMYPLLSVQSVRYRPVVVLKIQNNLANTPIARASVTNAGLTLTWTTSGVVSTNTSITYATNPTILALQNAVNALGSGWSAVGAGYDQWPAVDLYCPNGVSGSSGPQPVYAGALTAAGQFAELRMHTYELAGYQTDQRRGWLLRAIPYTDPELLHPEDLIWPAGINNFRIQYTAGYASVPEDVQEATAELVATMFAERGRDAYLLSEHLVGSASYTVEKLGALLPCRIRALLAPYRYHRVFNQMG